MQAYSYRKLPQKPNVIRLLRLLPSKVSSEHIQCELFEYTIQTSSTSHMYEALSYCWGGEEKPRSILIIGGQDGKNSQELAVTENLYMALLHLRDYTLPRVLWVDAVCIDQAIEGEKVSQIKLVPAIYAKASRVIVWLGTARDDSDKAFDLIITAANASIMLSSTQPAQDDRDNESVTSSNTQLTQDDCDNESITSSNTQPLEKEIQQLLDRPWFSRVWVSNPVYH